MSEMTEERLNEIERVIRQKDYSGSLRLKMAYHDITELVAEVRRLREAAKGQAIIADQAAARIRELEKENEHLKELRVHRMEVENGSINFSIQGEAGQAFAAILLRFFEDNGGKNFFSFDVMKEGVNLNVTIKKLDGELSPVEKLNQMEKQNRKMYKTLEWIRDEGSDHWSIRKARNILNELEVVTDD